MVTMTLMPHLTTPPRHPFKPSRTPVHHPRQASSLAHPLDLLPTLVNTCRILWLWLNIRHHRLQQSRSSQIRHHHIPRDQTMEIQIEPLLVSLTVAVPTLALMRIIPQRYLRGHRHRHRNPPIVYLPSPLYLSESSFNYMLRTMLSSPITSPLTHFKCTITLDVVSIHILDPDFHGLS